MLSVDRVGHDTGSAIVPQTKGSACRTAGMSVKPATTRVRRGHEVVRPSADCFLREQWQLRQIGDALDVIRNYSGRHHALPIIGAAVVRGAEDRLESRILVFA